MNQSQPKSFFQVLFIILLVIGLLYIGLAGTMWQFNNPKANQMSFWTHLNDALKFKSLPQFQE